MDTISGYLALRVLRNSLARDPRSSVAVGSGWRGASALWTTAEWTSDGCQCWNDARSRHALHSASPEPDVAGRDVENAAPILSRPGAARNVQHRRSRDALRGQPHPGDLPTSSRKEEGGLIRTWLRILQDFTFAFYRQRVGMSGGDTERNAE